MIRPFLIFILLASISANGVAQKNILQSGPMVGYSTMKEVQLWVQTKEPATVKFEYWRKGQKENRQYTDEVTTNRKNAFAAKITIGQLEPGLVYEYALYINGNFIGLHYSLQFQTQPLWQWRMDPPEINFALGSCFYVNEKRYDRPGAPYGNEADILNSIYRDQPNFMLWLGDNVYLREADWNSRYGIFHRYTHTRSLPELQPLLGSVHHYAIWDDHDYGPNDSDRGFWNKTITEEAFNTFWCNPNTNLTGKGGITSTFIWGDVQFFLLDDRYFRSPQKALYDEQIIGKDQFKWLMDALQYSKATFKFIAIGGQVLNPAAVFENYAVFAEERNALIQSVTDSGVEGVVFLTGDRHHTELTKMENKGHYPYYDLTVSPLTSGTHDPTDEGNTLQVPNSLVVKRNYALVKVTGSLEDRKLSIQIKSAKGKVLWERELKASQLKASE